MPDQKLMISQRMTPAQQGQVGTWVAAGAINDAGSATAEVSTDLNTGHGTGTHTLTSSAGTLTLKENVRIQPWPPPTPRRLLIVGTWKLTGTGAYAGLKAGGKTYATVDRVKDPPEITFVRDSTP